MEEVRGVRDYHLALVCERGHRRRELAVLVPVRPRADLAFIAEMSGTPLPAPTGEYAKALARGWGVAETVRGFEPQHGELREINTHGIRKSAVPTQERSDGTVLLRLECPTCPANQRVSWLSADDLFREGDRLAGVNPTPGQRVRVDVSRLPPIAS
jgi:hypothetical protein